VRIFALCRWATPIGMLLVCKMKGKHGIYEVRTNLIDRIARVFFIVDGNNMILPHGFIKKTQATPQQDLELTETRVKSLNQRKST
jgi:phage-related protein